MQTDLFETQAAYSTVSTVQLKTVPCVNQLLSCGLCPNLIIQSIYRTNLDLIIRLIQLLEFEMFELWDKNSKKLNVSMTTEGMQKREGKNGPGNIRKWVSHSDLPHWQSRKGRKGIMMVYGCGMLRTAWEGGEMHSSFAFSSINTIWGFCFGWNNNPILFQLNHGPAGLDQQNFCNTIIVSVLKQNTFSTSCTFVTDSYATFKQVT